MSTTFGWAKLGKIYWPGEVIPESKFTPEMKNTFNKKKNCLKIIQFFNEEGFEPITKESDWISYDDNKKYELIKKGAAHLKKLKDDSSYKKYRSDIIEIETLLGNRTRELSSVWFDKIVTNEDNTPKKSIVKEIFQKPVQLKIKPGVVIIKPKTTKRKSNIIVDEDDDCKKKRYACACGFGTDRVNALTFHKRNCDGASSSKVAKGCQVSSSVGRSVGRPRKESAKVTKVQSPKKPDPIKVKKVKKTKQELIAGILADWSSSDSVSSEGEDESPPELRIFETQNEGTVLKKEEEPNKNFKSGRSDKELSDAFEELLKATKVPNIDLTQEHTNIENYNQDEVKVKLLENEPMREEESDRTATEEPMREEENTATEGPMREEENESPIQPHPLDSVKNANKPTAAVRPQSQSIDEIIESKKPILMQDEIPSTSNSNIVTNAVENYELLNSEENVVVGLDSDQIVHLVPVENADGTITYMLLSLNQNQPGTLKINQTGDTTGDVINGSEMEAIFIDKGLDVGSMLESITKTKEELTSQPESIEEEGSQVEG